MVFDKKSLKLVQNHLSNYKKQVKTNDSYSPWTENLYGVPQGSILGPLLVNILFLGDYKIGNYAEDTTPYSAQRNRQFVIKELEKSSAIFFKWLGHNFMKINTDTSPLLLSGNIKLTSNIDNNLVESEMKQEFLEITVNSNLTFEEHVNNICKKRS